MTRVRTALSDRYAIERELGSGGMATVFLARDRKHEREVAVKVLRAELAAAVGSERFLREIRITAQLNHPHILPLLDSGQADGVLYYVMPYVTGGSLRPSLGGAAPLPLEATLLITRQVASALDYAHRRQVIHRDIKPENILFSEGHAVVSDFGIARAVSTVGRDALTRTGAPLGTPGYMSPEQAMGMTDPDERTDVYSLACVAYEMLVGSTPLVWPSDEDVRLGRLSDAPPEHRDRLDALPGRIEQALTRALAVRPADRFATPGQLAEALAAATESGLKFSDAEVREIIGRAAELQSTQPTEDGALSIGAVEQVAAEVGIPPQHVRAAARELERRPAAPPVTRSGPPRFFKSDKLRYTRIVDGEVPESAHEAL
ncbi:MAG: serine/threonine-protein kinase, partial [Gemmatimonadales bacterium]